MMKMDVVENENAAVSLQRIEKIVGEQADLLTPEFLEFVKTSDQRFSQLLVDQEGDEPTYFLTTVHSFFTVSGTEVNEYPKSEVEKVTVAKPTPNGELTITLKDQTTISAAKIVCGRVYDFAQEIKPKVITLAGYDNTIRGEFPQLLDPDHAEEVDRLRRWMQDGHISHYEYDDANPVYPKAGK